MEAERKFQAFGARTRHQQRRSDQAHSGHQYQERQWQRYDPPLARDHLDEAFKALGLRSSASVEEIKRAYRRQISQHHPDKLEATGASQERMQKATEKTQKIQKAYEAIQKARRF
jgi:DnaJ like chaperone protein